MLPEPAPVTVPLPEAKQIAEPITSSATAEGVRANVAFCTVPLLTPLADAPESNGLAALPLTSIPNVVGNALDRPLIEMVQAPEDVATAQNMLTP